MKPTFDACSHTNTHTYKCTHTLTHSHSHTLSFLCRCTRLLRDVQLCFCLDPESSANNIDEGAVFAKVVKEARLAMQITAKTKQCVVIVNTASSRKPTLRATAARNQKKKRIGERSIPGTVSWPGSERFCRDFSEKVGEGDRDQDKRLVGGERSGLIRELWKQKGTWKIEEKTTHWKSNLHKVPQLDQNSSNRSSRQIFLGNVLPILALKA